MKNDKLIEAILFAAGNRIAVSRIIELSGLSEAKVNEALHRLMEKYQTADSTFELTQMGNEWKFTVKREYLSVVEKIAPDTELTKTVIETLAIIAWKSPVQQSDIVKIRGNKSYDHISELTDKGFVEKQRSGRTYVMKITSKFYDYFDIDKSQINSMFDKFEGTENVKEEELVEADKAEEERRVAELAALENQPTFDEIRAEEHADQKEFFDKIENQISASTVRTDEIVSEIQKLKPADDEIGEMSDEGIVAMESAEDEVEIAIIAEHESVVDSAELETQVETVESDSDDTLKKPVDKSE